MLNQTNAVNSPSSALLAIMQNSTWPIYVTGPHTIVFHLVAPFNYFLGTLVVFQGLIFDTQWLLQHGDSVRQGHITHFLITTQFQEPAPYVVTSVSPNSYVKFSKNPTYWAANMSSTQLQSNEYLDPGHVQNVVVQVKSDDFARFTDLQGSSPSSPVIRRFWTKTGRQ